MRKMLLSGVGAVIAIKLVSMFSPEFGGFLVNLLNYLLNGLITAIQWFQQMLKVFLT